MNRIKSTMNKTSWGWIVALWLAVAMLPGCRGRTSGEVVAGGFGNDPLVYIDRATGCEYLSDGKGLTPRMQRDGKHICRTTPP